MRVEPRSQTLPSSPTAAWVPSTSTLLDLYAGKMKIKEDEYGSRFGHVIGAARPSKNMNILRKRSSEAFLFTIIRKNSSK